MPVKHINKYPGYFNRGSRERQGCSRKTWDIIRKWVAMNILCESVYGITKPFGSGGRSKIKQLAPELLPLLPSVRYLDQPWYEAQKSLSYIVRYIKVLPTAYILKEVPMINESKLAFDIEELVEFIFNYRERTRLYWWVGTYEPNAETTELVSTSLRGYMEGKLWSPLPDETAKCCKELSENMEQLSNAERDGFDPYVWMKHCCTKDHIREVLKRRTLKQLEAEYEYMLELAMQALTDNV